MPLLSIRNTQQTNTCTMYSNMKGELWYKKCYRAKNIIHFSLFKYRLSNINWVNLK